MIAEVMQISVDQSKCKNCGICVLECPNQTNLEGTKHVDHNSILCDRCYHCYAICPSNAISMDRKFDDSILQAQEITYEPFISLLKKRRSTRHFTERDIPPDIMEDLLDSTRFIPSGGNNHEMTITVIEDKEKRQRLQGKIYDYLKRIMKFAQNPLIRNVLKIVGDEKVREAFKDRNFLDKIDIMLNRMESGEDLVFYDAPAVMIFHTKRALPTAKEDCVLAAYNVSLTAEILGLGACFVSISQQALTADTGTKEAAGIDRNDKVYAVLVLGYAKQKFQRSAFREMKKAIFI